MNKLFCCLVAAISVLTTGNIGAAPCATVMEPIGDLGDFELMADPEDPSILLLSSNIGTDTARGVPVYTYQMDGTSGLFSAISTQLANEHIGIDRLNGPEFMYHPDIGVCVLYPGFGGVRANCRKDGVWNNDVHGYPFIGEPPLLGGTAEGRYPGGARLGQKTRGEFLEFSDGTAFVGDVTGDITTDVADALKAEGYDLVAKSLHAGADGYGIFAACKGATECAFYQVAFDPHGGIDFKGTWLRLTDFDPLITHARQCLSGIHPVTGHLVLYAIGGRQLWVWEWDSALPAPDLPDNPDLARGLVGMTIWDELPFRPQHLRIESSSDALYLHMLDKVGRDKGSYLSTYDDTLHAPKFISDEAAGAELIWMPQASKLALFFKEKAKDRLRRCWVDP